MAFIERNPPWTLDLVGITERSSVMDIISNRKQLIFVSLFKYKKNSKALLTLLVQFATLVGGNTNSPIVSTNGTDPSQA